MQIGLFADVEVANSRPKQATPKTADDFDDAELANLVPDEQPGLFPGTLISEGVTISLQEVEHAKHVERARQDEERRRWAPRPLKPSDAKAVEECRRVDEVRRRNAELAADERRKAAETRRSTINQARTIA